MSFQLTYPLALWTAALRYCWLRKWHIGRKIYSIFRSTLRQSRPNKADVKCPSIHTTYVRTYVRPSTKCFFDFNEIWRVMHDGMHSALWPDPRLRSQAPESRKSGHFQKLSRPPFTMGAGNWPRILKPGHNV